MDVKSYMDYFYSFCLGLSESMNEVCYLLYMYDLFSTSYLSIHITVPYASVIRTSGLVD